jgi:hypothetical protein
MNSEENTNESNLKVKISDDQKFNLEIKSSDMDLKINASNSSAISPDDLNSVIMRKSKFDVDTNKNALIDLKSESQLYKQVNYFIDKDTSTLQKKKNHIRKIHDCQLDSRIPALVENDNNQTEPPSQISSLSSISTMLHGSWETKSFLPPTKVKRKRIDFCCVG